MKNLQKLFSMAYFPNYPKNLIQFLVGLSLYFLFFHQLNYLKALIGLLSFLFSYSFVYALNDWVDFEKDKKSKKIRERKLKFLAPLMLKVCKPKELLFFNLQFLFIGLFLAFFVSTLFLFLLLVLLFTNLLHSNIFLKVRKNPFLLVPNMLLMQFLKFSIGWFSQSPTFHNFPFWLFLLFAGSYVGSYSLWKWEFRFRERKLPLALIGILILFCYILSLFIYKLILPLLIPLIFIPLLLSIYKHFKPSPYFSIIASFVGMMGFFVFAILVLLLYYDPYLWNINQKLFLALEEVRMLVKFKNLEDLALVNLTYDFCKLFCKC